VAFPELSSALAAAHLADVRANPGHSGTIGAAKDYSLPGSSGLKGQRARNSKVQADALQSRWTCQRLPAHLVLGSSSNFSSRRIIPANLNNAADARRDSLC